MNNLMDDIDGLSPDKESELRSAIATAQQAYYGRMGDKYFPLLELLPKVETSHVRLDEAQLACECDPALSDDQKSELEKVLRQLSPWRKGPVDLLGVEIDSEWRSNLKWDRIVDSLPPLKNKRVFDIGAGNGYYLLRMATSEPWLALGIDPFVLYSCQFLAMQHYFKTPRIHMLPLSLEQFPMLPKFFDVVFCMGVLYHQKSPLDFLRTLREYLRPGGSLVLETLTVAGDGPWVLSPVERYAKMRNCFLIPTVSCLIGWLERSGFSDIRIIDQSMTTPAEQRTTSWMPLQSLSDFLDPQDSSKTVEGYPAPQRSIVTCKRMR